LILVFREMIRVIVSLPLIKICLEQNSCKRVGMENRRDFIKQAALLTAVAGFPAIAQSKTEISSLKKDTDLRILFQGDSITDGNRTRNEDWNHVMGHGYQYIISSKLWYEEPDRKFHFFNRGVSGNKVSDLASRWQTDTLDLKPDVLSILVGVNDANEAVNDRLKNSSLKYQSGYRDLLNRAKEDNPKIKFIICEPFLLRVGKVTNDWEFWWEEVKKRQVIAKALADEFDAVFGPFQLAFDKALKRAPADYWIWDGIHPMPAGHELMAREWLKCVKTGKLI
jgi:lysophospholipase L1-like esterase